MGSHCLLSGRLRADLTLSEAAQICMHHTLPYPEYLQPFTGCCHGMPQQPTAAHSPLLLSRMFFCSSPLCMPLQLHIQSYPIHHQLRSSSQASTTLLSSTAAWWEPRTSSSSELLSLETPPALRSIRMQRSGKSGRCSETCHSAAQSSATPAPGCRCASPSCRASSGASRIDIRLRRRNPSPGVGAAFSCAHNTHWLISAR